MIDCPRVMLHPGVTIEQIDKDQLSKEQIKLDVVESL